MLMITAQHLGQIVARLAIADENFMKDMLKSAEIAEKKLFPDDVDALHQWSVFIDILRVSMKRKHHPEGTA